MVRKKMEGDDKQRRKRAREAREEGHAPSETGATTGGSKQRQHIADAKRFSHEERVDTKHGGKQQNWPPDPSTGSREESYNTDEPREE